ncbi:flagellar basal body rod protein FlgC [Sphingomonas oleivorans]|uniref:Flagellar basal-body rod protein FlgC n=1 Tax=Sphingomonas oleivorans TaxID=1735121 RepID=A0A2T5FUE9_9SPHN|nr:flagellar basal body rod protein FlgC [Sphingomonas oleivorans]PTQ08147.1 flagellar basal body rod protein FlgC [Sphingomonas oleivorans]
MANPLSVYDIAGRAMSAQLVRLNTTASNLANAGSVAGSKDGAFRALKPVFSSVTDAPGVATVKVTQVVASQTEPTRRHSPDHPLADANGDVWEAGVDSAAEMVEMLETARQYQNNVQVMQTAKSLTLDTLRLGK